VSSNYLKSSRAARKDLGEYTLFGKINVYTLAPVPEVVDVSYVLDVIEEKIPSVFFHDIDSIFIGEFKEFVERDVNAFYSDGAIFVTNWQDSNEDLLDDIVHEAAHAVWRMFPEYIYDDNLEQEFFGKRKRLFHRLRGEGWKISIGPFLKMEYSKEFDEFLYMEIGYPILTNLTFDLFNSPYGITSFQEYWANGFEGFFVDDPYRIKSISPEIYNKITTLINKYR